MARVSQNGPFELNGWLGPDVYSTAWVALVPHADDPARPAWPEALAYLRSHQLEDGGWGEPHVYYAHERTICTLAAIRALNSWQASQDDAARIRRGLIALRRYAEDLAYEPHEPIGFELLLPRLRSELTLAFGAELPLDEWASIDALNSEKLALIQGLHPDPAAPRAWWFNMEMLPEEQLARLDDSLLEINGSVSTSIAATAAYLWARRRAGADAPRAANYLTHVMEAGEGGAPLLWPADTFERAWVLDTFRRAGFHPTDPIAVPIVESVHASWNLNEPGLAYSGALRVNDGDDTAVGFTVLNWAGLLPPDEPLLAFWYGDHFRTYPDERDASVSANVHALMALRSQPGFPHRDLAERMTVWLIERLKPGVIFDDKWHLSPYYPVTRAVSAFAGWDDRIALRCVTLLLENQRPDGGWGWFRRSTLEETAYCVIALCHAFERGLLKEDTPLVRAAGFLQANADREAVERLWIGKALYRPEGLLKASLFAAKVALGRLCPAPCLIGDRGLAVPPVG
jgi:hypothetical protein